MRLPVFYTLPVSILLLSVCINETAAQFNKDARAFTAKGDEFLSTLKYDDAITNYNSAIGIDANYADAYYKRGFSYSNKKEPDSNKRKLNLNLAVKDFTKAISLQPDSSMYYFHRGEAFRIKKVVDSALLDYSKAISLDRNLNSNLSRAKRWYQTRGDLYQQKRIFELAINDYSKLISIDPNNADFFRLRSRAYYNSNRIDQALQDVLRDFSTDSALYKNNNYRGIYYNGQGKYEKSILEFLTYIIKIPDHGNPYISIISPLVRLKRFNEAALFYKLFAEKKIYKDQNARFGEIRFESFLSQGTYKFYTYYIKAVVQVAENKFPDALATLDIAAEEYGTDIKEETKRAYIDILSLKGNMLEKLNRNEDAKIMYEKSLAIDPRQPDISEALQRILENKEVTRAIDKTPPVIELKNPAPSRGFDIVADNIKTQITIRAKDESGIASVKIDNTPVTNVDEDGYFFIEKNLKPGANSLVVTATDKAGNMATKTVTINAALAATNQDRITEQPIAAGSTPKFYAIFIAANDYLAPITDLEHPINDARNLKAILQTNYTFDAANIDTLFNKSRIEIMQKIDQRSSTLGPDDNLLIFYAGHGTTTLNKDNTRDGFLIPSDALLGTKSTYISIYDIKSVLKNSNAKHILVIADACFSGALTRDLPKDASAAIKLQYENISRSAMTSGNLTTVPDVSKFIYYLNQKLKENKEKYLTAKKLFESFSDIVLNNTTPPTAPLYRGIQEVGDEGGEFIFIKRNQ